MEAYLERIVTQARELRAQMAAFPPLDKPMYETFIGITNMVLRPNDKCAEAQVTFGLLGSNEFVDLADYWTSISRILAGNAHPGQKAKALFAFDCAMSMYYFRKGISQGTPAQKAVLGTVQRMLYDLTQKAPKQPCIVFVPKGDNKLLKGVNHMNKESLENALFLNYEEIKKMYQFTSKRSFSEGLPYAAVISGITFVPYEP
jgi:hypothetical protein